MSKTPKFRLVDSNAIEDYLKRDPKSGEFESRIIRVVYQHSRSDCALTVDPKELLILAAKRMVIGEVDRRDYLKRAVLMTSASAAYRVLRGYRRPLMPSLFISRKKQARGAKNWVARHDRANGGIAGRHQQIQTKVQSQAEYELRMNEAFGIQARAA